MSSMFRGLIVLFAISGCAQADSPLAPKALEEVPTVFPVEIWSKPIGANFTLHLTAEDGTQVPIDSGLTNVVLSLPVGLYTMRQSMGGYATFSKSFIVKGESDTLSIGSTLERPRREPPLPVPVAGISVSSDTVLVGAKVTICVTSSYAEESYLNPLAQFFKGDANRCYGRQVSETTTFAFYVAGTNGQVALAHQKVVVK